SPSAPADRRTPPVPMGRRRAASASAVPASAAAPARHRYRPPGSSRSAPRRSMRPRGFVIARDDPATKRSAVDPRPGTRCKNASLEPAGAPTTTSKDAERSMARGRTPVTKRIGQRLRRIIERPASVSLAKYEKLLPQIEQREDDLRELTDEEL